MNMSSKSKEHQNIETQAASAPQEGAGLEQIRIRAYEIYLERGGQPGHDLDDWIQAERDLEPKVWPAQAGQ
jgi:hypothetical protein